MLLVFKPYFAMSSPDRYIDAFSVPGVDVAYESGVDESAVAPAPP